MNRNFMKMNDGKTGYTKFGNKKQLLKCAWNVIQVGDVKVQASSGSNYLGHLMEEEMAFKNHIQNKSRIASQKSIQHKEIEKTSIQGKHGDTSTWLSNVTSRLL